MVVDVAETLASLAGALVEDADVVELMDRLVTESVRLVAARAARLVVDDGRGGSAVLATAAPTPEARALLEALPVASPGQDALVRSETLACRDLAEELQRWPEFRPRAVAAGLRSVVALPLRRRGWSLGAMCVYDEVPRTFAPLEVTVLGALADIATIGLLQHRTVRGSAEVAGQLQRALDARVVIEQACGVLAVREGVAPADARGLLRAQAQEQGVPLLRLAEQVVASTTR